MFLFTKETDEVFISMNTVLTIMMATRDRRDYRCCQRIVAKITFYDFFELFLLKTLPLGS